MKLNEEIPVNENTLLIHWAKYSMDMEQLAPSAIAAHILLHPLTSKYVLAITCQSLKNPSIISTSFLSITPSIWLFHAQTDPVLQSIFRLMITSNIHGPHCGLMQLHFH